RAGTHRSLQLRRGGLGRDRGSRGRDAGCSRRVRCHTSAFSGASPVTTLVLIWLVVASALLFLRWHLSRGLGLFVAFMWSLSSLHFLAATIYVLPWFPGLDRDYVQAGLFIALEGLAGFGIGAVLMSRFLQSETEAFPSESQPQRLLGVMYLVVGGVMYTF